MTGTVKTVNPNDSIRKAKTGTVKTVNAIDCIKKTMAGTVNNNKSN